MASAITWAVRVAQDQQGLGVAVGQDGDGVVAGELGGEIDDLAVDLGRRRRPWRGRLPIESARSQHGGAVGELFD